MSEQRRHRRKEIQLLQAESVWLQKALFALRKADSERDKLADVRDEEVTTYELAGLPLEKIEDALEERSKELTATVRQMRRDLA